MSQYEGELRAVPSARYAIVASRWNPRIVDALVDGARRTFIGHGIPASSLDVVRVPGTWEIPLVAARLAQLERYAGIVAVGCVVRGDTRHYEHVADCCADGLMRVALEYGVPIGNGVLAVEKHEDAQARADGALGNKGEEATLAVIEMADLLPRLSTHP